MNQKRSRSLNWDEEEKQLLRSVLKEYAQIIENKSLDTNTNKIKTKAWEEVHKKFNELNGRNRQLSQLKIQWKTMKVNARKTYGAFRNQACKTGGGPRPVTPDEAVIEIKDLLNPAELLIDHNVYDSDGIDSKAVTCTVKTLDTSLNDVNLQNQQIADIICLETIEEVDSQVEVQEVIPFMISQDNDIKATPIKKNMGTVSAKKVPKRKIILKNFKENESKSKLDHEYYVKKMISHSQMLKDEEHMRRMEMADEEHRRRMEMAEEEHTIKMAIHKGNLKCVALETEILEFKKAREQKLV